MTVATILTVAAAIAAAAMPAAAAPCPMFDSDGGLYFFGVAGADYSAGSASSAWASPQLTALTSSGRPAFDGNNTQCFLSQYYNSMYVLHGDAANPTNVYIFDFTQKTWSTQTVASSSAAPNPATLTASIDRDTNVFYAYDAGYLWYLSFASITTTAVTASPPAWVQASTFAPTSDTAYSAVIGAAHNHLHFLNVPGSAVGDAYIYVIHYAYWQPAAQNYPSTSSALASFPVQPGQAATIWNTNSTIQPAAFAFIPDDGSYTYIVDTNTNATTVFAAPPSFSASASYAASSTYLAYLSDAGAAAFVSVDATAGSSSWTTISSSTLASLANYTSSSSGSSTSATGSAASTSATASSTSKSSSTSAASSGPVSSFVGLALQLLAAAAAAGAVALVVNAV